MKIFFKTACVIAGFLGTILLSPSVSGADKLASVLLSQSEVPAECSLIEGTFPVDIQTAILYEHYDTYKKMLPPLVDKQAQSLRCKKETGTIYYFAFEDAAGREHAEKFIQPLLWGADHPTGEHPEQIEHGGNLLVVISFKKAPSDVLEAVRSKLSSRTKPPATTAPSQ
jgi:hypothetical protein